MIATTDTQQKKKSSSQKASGAHGKRRRGKNVRKGRRRRGRVRSEFEHRVIDVRRVARVVRGGRRFSFSVVVIAGDRKGRVGVGVGKALDTASAIDKALRDAKAHMLRLTLTKEFSIPHEVEAKYSSAHIRIYPAPGKGGITAGGAVRNVLELAGVKGVGAKIVSRSKNKLNNSRATLKALKKLQQKRNGKNQGTKVQSKDQKSKNEKQ